MNNNIKQCTVCKRELVKALLEAGSYNVRVSQQTKKGFFISDNRVDIDVYVCKNCEHVDLFASNPQKLKDGIL